MRIEIDLKNVSLTPLITPREHGGDAVGLCIVADCTDVDRVIVVEDLKCRLLRCRLALVRITLGETSLQRSCGPFRYLDTPVENGGLICTYRMRSTLRVSEPVLHALIR